MKVKLTESKLREIVSESVKRILSERYDDNGFNDKSRVHKDTRTKFNPEGYDWEGYDIKGYNKDGWNRDGINKFTNGKYDKTGYDKDGFNKFGLNRQNKRRDGRNFLGYDDEGYDEKGFHKNGWNKRGINKFTKTKYDKEGWNINGYNILGRDKNGFNRHGTHMYGYTQNENSKSFSKIFVNEEAFHKLVKLLNINLNPQNHVHRKFNMIGIISEALYDFFKKNKDEVLQIPYNPSVGEYVDEETGIVIDLTTVGTVINSVMKILTGYAPYPSDLIKGGENYFIQNYINVLYNIVREHYKELFKCFTNNGAFKIFSYFFNPTYETYSIWVQLCHKISEYNNKKLVYEKTEPLINNHYDDEDDYYYDDEDDEDDYSTDDWIRYWDAQD